MLSALPARADSRHISCSRWTVLPSAALGLPFPLFNRAPIKRRSRDMEMPRQVPCDRAPEAPAPLSEAVPWC